MAADLHHVLDQSLDCLLFAEFSLKTLTKSIDDRLGKRLSCVLRWSLMLRGIVPRLLLST
jgi:hypothetical protein